MKNLIVLFAIFLLLGTTFASSTDTIVKETTKGKWIEVEVLSEGNINMFSHESQVIPTTIPEDPFEDYTKTYTTFFISKGENELVEIKISNYKDVLKNQMKDNPELASRVGQKGYKFQDLESMILQYNKK